MDHTNWDRLVAFGITSLGVFLIKEVISTRLKKIFYHHVGKVHKIEIYPLKGARGIEVSEALVTSYGIQVNGVLDRSFVVYRPDIHEFRSSWHSETRKISKINVKIVSSSSIEISASGVGKVTVSPTENLIQSLEVSGVVAENLLDCGDLAASWLTNFENNGINYRIAFFDKKVSMRNTEKLANKPEKATKNSSLTNQSPLYKISLQEKSSLILITKRSLDKINCGIENFKNPEQFMNSVDNAGFRANLVVNSFYRPWLFNESWCELVIGKLENYVFTVGKPIYGAVGQESSMGVKYFDMCRNHAGLICKRRVHVGDEVYAKIF